MIAFECAESEIEEAQFAMVQTLAQLYIVHWNPRFQDPLDRIPCLT